MTRRERKKLDFYAWYPGDFRQDTQHLTREERWAYRDILDEIFVSHQDACSLPDDDAHLCRVVGRSLDEWKTMRHALLDGPEPMLKKFRGRVSSARLTEEIDKAKVKSGIRAEAAHSRWNANANHKQPDARQIEIEKKKEKEKKTEPTPPVVPLPGDAATAVEPEKRTRKKTATHMTPEWRPSAEWISRLEAECPAVDVERVIPEFRDYWIGEGKPKADFDATFRNRIRQIDALIGDGNRTVIASYGRANRRTTPGDTGGGARPSGSQRPSKFNHRPGTELLDEREVRPVLGDASGGPDDPVRRV